MAKFRDIPQLTSASPYAVDVGWSFLLEWLDRAVKEDKLDMDPEFQREHVWTREQQMRYVEFVLRGGQSGRDILTNCPGWMKQTTSMGPYVLVDGKQRLQAVQLFLTDKLPAFGSLRSAYTDSMRLHLPSFRWHVNSLETQAQVLAWYLENNAGGTPHTEKELNKVRAMLVKEITD